MKELFRTNDPVRLSAARSLLEGEDIMSFHLDQNMSVLEGGIGAFPQRLMVADRDHFQAVSLLREAGLLE